MTEVKPREQLRRMIAERDVQGLLNRTAEIHGHYCPGMSAGVKASCIGYERLGITDHQGMEDVMAVVECNNCFVDGIQAVSGCTFGNNAMIYRDLGKTAVSFFRRGQDKGVRIALKDFFPRGEEWEAKDEADRLFEKAVKERKELTSEEHERFMELWKEAAFRLMECPDEEVFSIREVTPQAPEYAPILESIECSECGESVMETRIRMRNGQPVCMSCADERHWLVDGSGIKMSGQRKK